MWTKNLMSLSFMMQCVLKNMSKLWMNRKLRMNEMNRNMRMRMDRKMGMRMKRKMGLRKDLQLVPRERLHRLFGLISRK